MFIGHYGPAFAAKAVERRVPLALLFVAVQWLDIVWSALVMLNIEKLHVVKGFTEGSALDLYYMPYTHGLVGALALSIVLGALAALFYRERRLAVAAVVAGAVFSHWILDLLVHVPDMPLLGDSFKVGLGLWRHVWISFPLEIALLIAGALLYAREVPSVTRFGDIGLWLFVAAMTAGETYAAFGPEPASPIDEAHTAIVAYLGLAAFAGIVDWGRGTVGIGEARVPVPLPNLAG
jgi:membrane-bound metal-dependent hydrolase YbcI (DUF457 family)